MLEQAGLAGRVGRIHLSIIEMRAGRDETLVESLPLDLGDERPHRLHHRRGVAEVLPPRHGLSHERVVDPDVGQPVERERIERDLLAVPREVRQAIDREGLTVGASDDFRPGRERVP